MSKMGEKVAYLKGLAEGLGVNAETEQGKLMLAMIDTLEAFAEQIEDWEELEGLTGRQLAEMIADPNVPTRIKKQLNENGYLIESYWESVSEASFDLVKKYRVSQGLPAEPNN